MSTVHDCVDVRIKEYEDCEGQPFRVSIKTHCIVSHPNGCKVGAIQRKNPNYPPNGLTTFDEDPYIYLRLYDWECPEGVTPPFFKFYDTLTAPLACDPLTPLPRNSLLHAREEKRKWVCSGCSEETIDPKTQQILEHFDKEEYPK